jgi:hypothetical protein
MMQQFMQFKSLVQFKRLGKRNHSLELQTIAAMFIAAKT